MSGQLQEIAEMIRSCSRDDVEELRNWIEDYLEERLELTEDFVARIERGKRDLVEGSVRIREPK